ncbi:MAG: endonuclease/exonuclease/phosphatase family protein [Patescibacteria group bacterium]|nr:endonuclease/exonuclease/phosphatase family protein [Patescibacteria group bacterium]
MSSLFLGVAAALLAAGDGADGLQVDVMTFNIRYGTANDGENAWPLRKDMACAVLRDAKPDFCGLQEALRYQIDAIHDGVPGYAEHGVGREDGRQKGEYSAILYRADRWKPDRGGTQWLSDTPTVPGSATWGNTIPRIITWGRFVEKTTGRAVLVFNTHFDHQSQPSRLKSAMALASLIGEEAGEEPVVVTGDMNAGEDNPAILHLKHPDGNAKTALVDTFRVLYPDAKEVGTFNAFRGQTGGAKIDYVLTNPRAKVISAEIIRVNRDGRYPSDHFPVVARIVFP